MQDMGINKLASMFMGNPQPLANKIQRDQQQTKPGQIPPDLAQAIALQKIQEMHQAAQNQQAMQAGGPQATVVDKLRQMLQQQPQSQAQPSGMPPPPMAAGAPPQMPAGMPPPMPSGMPPQMAAGMPPQGMPPQSPPPGMPPQGIAQALPPQGMPPVKAAHGGHLGHLASNLSLHYDGGGIVAFAIGGDKGLSEQERKKLQAQTASYIEGARETARQRGDLQPEAQPRAPIEIPEVDNNIPGFEAGNLYAENMKAAQGTKPPEAQQPAEVKPSAPPAGIAGIGAATGKSEIQTLQEARDRYARSGSDTSAIDQAISHLSSKMRPVMQNDPRMGIAAIAPTDAAPAATPAAPSAMPAAGSTPAGINPVTGKPISQAAMDQGVAPMPRPQATRAETGKVPPRPPASPKPKPPAPPTAAVPPEAAAQNAVTPQTPAQAILDRAVTTTPEQEQAKRLANFEKTVPNRDLTPYDRSMEELEKRKKDFQAPEKGLPAFMEYLQQIANAPRGIGSLSAGAYGAQKLKELDESRKSQQFALNNQIIEQQQKKADTIRADAKEKFGIGDKAYDAMFKANMEAALQITKNEFEAKKLAQEMTNNQLNREKDLQVAKINASTHGTPTFADKMSELGIAEYMQKHPGSSRFDAMNELYTMRQGATPELKRAALIERFAEAWGKKSFVDKKALADQGIGENEWIQQQIKLTGIGNNANPAAEKTMTMADVQATAAKNGKTVQEVIEAAKKKGFVIK